MMSENEKHRLIAQMQPELNATGYAVLRCGLCVLLVAGLAASGVATSTSAAMTSDPDDDIVVAHAVYAGRQTLIESRRLYEERRERFEKRWSGRDATPGVMG